MSQRHVRVIFVGEAPATDKLTDLVLIGGKSSTAARLRKLLGWSEELAEYFMASGDVVFTNLYQVPQNGKWSKLDAVERAVNVVRDYSADLWVLLGERVADAFSHEAKALELYDGLGVRGIGIPHPSGRNRFWNDELNFKRAQRVLRKHIKEAMA